MKMRKERFGRWLSLNFAFYNGFELPYKNVHPRIIAEKFLSNGEDLFDYKISCFHGQPEYIWVDSKRYTGHKRNFFDLNWNYLPIKMNHPNDPNIQPKPAHLDLMLDLAKELSRDFLHVRVDFYDVGDKVYFGELTFFPDSGICKWDPSDYNYTFGQLLKFPVRKN
jgi:hypothetical protein